MPTELFGTGRGPTDLVVGVGFRDDAATRPGYDRYGDPRTVAHPDRDHPASVAATVAPAHCAGVEAAIAFEGCDQFRCRPGRYTADCRGGMQGESQIDCCC